MGPRAMAMGGAHTAIAEGPVASYYNPGALGQVISNPSGFELQTSGRFEINGEVIEGANDFYEVANQCRREAPAAVCNNVELSKAALKLRNPGGEGALAEAVGGLNLKFGRLAFFSNTFAFRGVTPDVDSGASLTVASLPNNRTNLRVRGASYYEFGVGYGHEILETGLFLGTNVKGIVGRTGFTDLPLTRENPELGAVIRNYDRSTNVSFMPGVDVGLLWDARESFPDVWGRPRVGFVGRNVNAPAFNQPARARELHDRYRYYNLQGQSRMGVALDPHRRWTVAVDFDITQNLTMVERHTSRLYAAGTELRLVDDPTFAIPLRGGVSKNIAQGNSGTLWTMGFGLHFMHFFMDFAAAIPERWHRVQSIGGVERLPHQFGLSAQLALLFGGTESIAEPNRDPFSTAPARTPKASSSTAPLNRDPFRR
ncbi:MAG: conjugal transfer protein TraF, partial [Elusimicrobia bacterium]|nr:conjugal transfer protein TraF [Elusimicrobiota bacterium]